MILTTICMIIMFAFLVIGFYNYIYYKKYVEKLENTTDDKILSSRKTLKNEGYECKKWMTNDLALRIRDGNVECASTDGKNCIDSCTADYDKTIDIGKPVVCGDYHQKLFDFNGYNDPNHWCAQYAYSKGNILTTKPRDDIIRHNDKVSLQGGQNNKYCADDSRWVQCNREKVDVWEAFYLERFDGDGEIMDGDIIFMRGIRKNQYCSYDDDNKIRCNRQNPGLWEKFIIINRSRPNNAIKHNDKIALKSVKSDKYCGDVHNVGDFNKIIRCDKEIIGEFEEFKISKL